MNYDSVFLKLTLSDLVSQVFDLISTTLKVIEVTYHEDDWLGVSSMHKGIEHLRDNFLNVVLLNE